ncbi:MAG: superoxide dismutase [Ni] [Desulfuromonas sp.]
MKSLTLGLTLSFLLFFTAANVYSHCEIPCGIYDDPLRISLLREDIATMEKSMKTILTLEKSVDQHANQLVRWVNNKEDHADKFQHIVAQYFMTQRINVGDANYAKKIQALQQMLVYAMKCKQTTDIAHIETLKSLVDEFEKLYFAKK